VIDFYTEEDASLAGSPFQGTESDIRSSLRKHLCLSFSLEYFKLIEAIKDLGFEATVMLCRFLYYGSMIL
jgi:hypothetical protein